MMEPVEPVRDRESSAFDGHCTPESAVKETSRLTKPEP